MSILEEARDLVYGDRDADYGSPIENWDRIARITSAIWHDKLKEPLTGEDMLLGMEGVKIGREVGKPKRDNRRDGAGYWDVLDQVVTARVGP